MYRFAYGLLLIVASSHVWAQTPVTTELSLRQAVEMALSSSGNTSVRLAAEGTQTAAARTGQARSSLMPNLAITAGAQNFARNLGAQGLTGIELPFFLRLPERIGPVNVFDARAGARVNVLDLGALGRYRAARANEDVARAELADVRNRVASLVSRHYIAALRTLADLESANANIDLAEAVVRQTESQRAAGTGIGLDVTRARVQLANDQQRRLIAENNHSRARLELLRAIGLSLDTELKLTDRLVFQPVETGSLPETRNKAKADRPDVQAQARREEAAKQALRAVRAERAPSLAAFADYGAAGRLAGASTGVHTVGIAMELPILDGGRRSARAAESASQLRRETVRTRDLLEQVDLELRVAGDALRSAAEQVKTAQLGLSLAESELTQARRRFEAGVATSLEVVDAQTRLARARDNHVSALYSHSLARIDLEEAMGTLASGAPQP